MEVTSLNTMRISAWHILLFAFFTMVNGMYGVCIFVVGLDNIQIEGERPTQPNLSTLVTEDNERYFRRNRVAEEKNMSSVSKAVVSVQSQRVDIQARRIVALAELENSLIFRHRVPLPCGFLLRGFAHFYNAPHQTTDL